MNTSDHRLLRFITAGSVDDGKSTLIGRLLYDSQAILTDQTHTLYKTRNTHLTASEEIDFSLLTDGLEAEREQGITIDVAYRYFRSTKRRFIIADTPGHEQYTRNMVTGASTADAAIILIDASRLNIHNPPIQLLPQTTRHSAIIQLLGLQHVIIAINKMDLIDYDQSSFEAICHVYQSLADQLGIKNIHYIPVSALRGDNIVHQRHTMPWYDGLPLLALLESLTTDNDQHIDHDTLRLPIQLVVRQDGDQSDDFRGYLGTLVAGSLKVGQRVRIFPRGHEATIKTIFTPNDTCQYAQTGQVITVQFHENIDVSRGDIIVNKNDTVTPIKQLHADLCWFDEQPLNMAKKYLLKQTTNTVYAKVTKIEKVFDVYTLSQDTGVYEMNINDIGVVRIHLQKPIIGDSYNMNLSTGAFILIDPNSNHTVAAGMIRTK